MGGEGIDQVVCFGDYLAFDVVGNLADFAVSSCVVEVAVVGGECPDIVVCFGDYLSLEVVGELADFAVLSCVVDVAFVGSDRKDVVVCFGNFSWSGVEEGVELVPARHDESCREGCVYGGRIKWVLLQEPLRVGPERHQITPACWRT